MRAVAQAVNESDEVDHDSSVLESTNSQADAQPQGQGKFVIRLPAGLLKKVSVSSRQHQRSMNSEINLLLGRYLEQQGLVEGEPDDQQESLDQRLLRKLNNMPTEKREALLQLLE